MKEWVTGYVSEVHWGTLERLQRTGLPEARLLRVAVEMFCACPRLPARRVHVSGDRWAVTELTSTLQDTAERYSVTPRTVLESAVADFCVAKRFAVVREDVFVPYRR